MNDTRSTRANPFPLLVALAIASLLLFTAYAKALHPNPKPVTIEWLESQVPGPAFDRTLAGLELLVAFAILALHRRAAAWLVNVLFFAALAGYALFKSWHGEACGCFAALWDPPPYSTFALDTMIVILSLILARALRAPRPMIAATAAVSLFFAAAGWAASDATTPPRRADTAQLHANKRAHTRLLESEPMRDLREQPPGGPAWLICAFDPTCHICEDMKPLIEFKRDELAETNDPILQVRIFSITELEKTLGIETFAWETPTIFVVQNGRITKLWSGNILENYTPERFQEIYDTLSSTGYAPGDAPPSHVDPKP
jgi:hypothetical protein